MIDLLRVFRKYHKALPFPPGCRGQKVEGLELSQVVADTYALISPFILSGGERLPAADLKRLQRLQQVLTLAADGRDGAEWFYLARLEAIAGMVVDGHDRRVGFSRPPAPKVEATTP